MRMQSFVLAMGESSEWMSNTAQTAAAWSGEKS